MKQNKQITIVIDDQEYVFNTTITMGEEIDMASRRAQMCKGYYDRMYGSKDPSEFFAAYNANRICEIDAFMHKAPDNWDGAKNLSSEMMDKFWEEWTEKSGRFSKKSKPGKSAPDSKEGSDPG